MHEPHDGEPAGRGFRLVTIDLDGTLVDTAGEIVEAANRTLADFGLPRQPLEVVARLIGAGAHALMRRLVTQVLEDAPGQAGSLPMDAVMGRLDHHYANTAGTAAQPYPGCVEGLLQLQRAGVRLACVTNKEERFARQVLESTGLDRRLELLIGGDTLAVRKPDRRVIDHVLSLLGESASQTAHVGDSRIDIETARNAGIAAWAVPYGYNAGEPITDARPHRLFGDLSEMAAHVLAVNACHREHPPPAVPDQVRAGT